MSQSNQNVACHFVGQVREKVFRFSIDLKKKKGKVTMFLGRFKLIPCKINN